MKTNVMLGSLLALVPFAAGAADLASEPAPDYVPAPAHVALWFGEAEAAVGYSWLSGDELGTEETDAFLFGSGALRLGMNFGSGFLVQGDLLGEITDASDDDSYVSGWAGAAHLAWRDPSRGLLGIFGAYGVTDQDDDSTDTTDVYLLGVEGQAYFGNWTLYGQGGYLDSNGEGPNDSIHDAGFARVVARYFIQPNTKLEAGLAGAFGKMDSDDDDLWLANWSLAAEHQLAGTPFSMFVGYDGTYYDQDGEGNITDHTIKVGARFVFGGGSEDLMSKDRYGATLDTPAFLRWSGITGGQLE